MVAVIRKAEREALLGKMDTNQAYQNVSCRIDLFQCSLTGFSAIILIQYSVLISISDRICKKRSYTGTPSAHKFHHHSMDTSLDYPCVHVEVAFWDVSDVHECSVCIQSSLLAAQQRLPD